MKLYLVHANKYPGFWDKLYLPLRRSMLNDQHEIVLPYESRDTPVDSSKLLDSLANGKGAVLAEITHHALGAGWEMGEAWGKGIPLIGLYQKEAQVSRSVRMRIGEDNCVVYSNSGEMIDGIAKQVERLEKVLRG